MERRLKVVKADGAREGYMHTKVIGTISRALTDFETDSVQKAENLAEVVTYYLYQQKQRTVDSAQILSIIKAVLSSTGYGRAAEKLEDYHHTRTLRRRIQEVGPSTDKPPDIAHRPQSSPWNKSLIVEDLVCQMQIDRPTARAIASAVEEKVFALAINRISKSLVNQLVIHETANFLRAKKQLQD